MSGTVNSAEAFISAQLGVLSENNLHHEFEKIATRVARRRISANILIANGPVSAGGDQQRDAESYTTYIPEELPHSAGFAAAASRSPVVVACTVQKKSLQAKILADVAGICAIDADPIDLIVVFSAASIAEATTHTLKEMVRKQYGVKLDVFSGMKVATLLAEPELIWIAQRYLDLPAHLVPPPDTDTLPDWYTQLLRDLRHNEGPASLSPASQGEIAAGLRHATWDEDANADLPEWIDFMGAFLAAENDDELVFRACYEMAIGRYRGTGIATGVEDLVRRALTIAGTSQQANILDDAAVLLSYWGAMWVSGAGRAEVAEITSAHAALVDHIREALSTTDAKNYPVRTASLTGTLAWLHLFPDWERIQAKNGTPVRVDAAEGAGTVADLDVIDDTVIDADEVVSLPVAMQYLLKLVTLLPQARGYALSRISDVVNLWAPLLATQPGYPTVRDAFDDALAEVEGDATVAERCHSRAVSFYKRGELLDALSELHKAKARCLRGDLADNAVNILRFISSIYLELDLNHAAKMYAFHAATFANLSMSDDVKAVVPAALFEAAAATHFTGCWVEASALTRVALVAHAAHAPGGFDFDRYPALAGQLQNELRKFVTVTTFWPELAPLLEDAHSPGDFHEYLAAQAAHPDAVIAEDEETFQHEESAFLTGPLFADLGPRRQADFCALGVRWVFTFSNEHRAVLAAEGFIAAFQVVLADIAKHHPVLLPCTVNASIVVKPTARGRATISDAGTDPYTATITVSESAADINGFARQLMATALALVAIPHVRPNEDLQSIMELMMADGLHHKLLCVRPYQESADYLEPSKYVRWADASPPASSGDFTPNHDTPLAASTEPVAGYDQEKFVTAVRATYENAAIWKYSMAAMLADEGVRERIADLRSEGWLDWHIIGALVNLAVQWRLEHLGVDVQTLDRSQEPAFLRQPETADEPSIPRPIDLRELDLFLYMHTAQVGMRWGLRPLPENPSEGRIRDLLTRRYQFTVVDVPHRDLLSAVDADGNFLPLLSPRGIHPRGESQKLDS
ncbi:hypothetical protein [Microbacterium sp. cf332]|uniref:hypothetical protein n=1 Tax=Microbacterium sp. cf332 TaxID=1761804 RepID=UPI000885DE87|nr:hypothetical protein [Microbacterium sp. cf332]SDQ12005.1 hypothetical protein SAMN04487847_0453 [Microbacterium sp. cf332]